MCWQILLLFLKTLSSYPHLWSAGSQAWASCLIDSMWGWGVIQIFDNTKQTFYNISYTYNSS